MSIDRENSQKKVKKLQDKFAQFCLGGVYHPIVGVKKERLQVYQDLILSNLNQALVHAYPVTHTILQEHEWRALVERFCLSYPHKSPHLWRMPEGLFHYVKEAKEAHAMNRPYLEELLLLEWLEIEVYMMEDQTCSSIEKGLDHNQGSLCLNPEMFLNHFHYPVFKMRADLLEKNYGHYFLATYREPETLKVKYFELSSLQILTFEIAESESITAVKALERALKQLNVHNFTKAQKEMFFSQLLSNHIIVGFSHV